tara:strand:- start:67 stop:435 length:369 start_codon:yes stop_codon:yes gene_type:complete
VGGEESTAQSQTKRKQNIQAKRKNKRCTPTQYQNGNTSKKEETKTNEQKKEEKAGPNKSENTGITSVDRSTKATLSTYNPWIQVSRLQKIYHFQHKKLIFTKHTLPFKLVHMQKGRDLMLVL